MLSHNFSAERGAKQSGSGAWRPAVGSEPYPTPSKSTRSLFGGLLPLPTPRGVQRGGRMLACLLTCFPRWLSHCPIASATISCCDHWSRAGTIEMGHFMAAITSSRKFPTPTLGGDALGRSSSARRQCGQQPHRCLDKRHPTDSSLLIRCGP
jgi:hypothetical protein